MKTILTLTLIIGSISLHAQSYSGKFKHKPSINEFEQFIVMKNPVGVNTTDVLSVKALGNDGELWHSVATYAAASIVKEVVENFQGQYDIHSVYHLQVDFKGEHLSYYMLEHRDENNEEKYLVVEEWYHGPEDIVHVEVNTFVWTHATVKN